MHKKRMAMLPILVLLSGCIAGGTEEMTSQDIETRESTAVYADEKETDKREITMEAIRQLSATGDDLTLTDFQIYQSEEILFPELLQYKFCDEGVEYSLDINYDRETEKIEHVRLVRLADSLSIDIRSGVIDHLIEGQVSMADYVKYEQPDDLTEGPYNIYLGNFGGNLFIKEEDDGVIYGGIEILSAEDMMRTEDMIVLSGKEDMECQIETSDSFSGTMGIGIVEMPLDVFLDSEGTAYLEGKQDFWIALFCQEERDVLYMFFLNSDFYSREDIVHLAETVTFSEKAFY